MTERRASDGSETGFRKDMDPEQLSAWLKGKLPTTLPQAVSDSICNTFETECIVGASFPKLTKVDLDDMKIKKGPQIEILDLISEIKGEQECRVSQKTTAIDDSVAANTNKGPPPVTTKGKVITPTNGDIPCSALKKSAHDPSNGADLQDAEFVSKGNMVSPAAKVNNPQTEQQDDDAPPQTANGNQPLDLPGEAEAAKVDTNDGGTGTTTNESKQNDQAAQTDNDDLALRYSCWARPSPLEAQLPGEGGAGACGEDDRHFWDKESLSVYMNPKEIPKLTHHKWSYKGHLISCETVAKIAQEWNDTREVPEMKYVPKLEFVYDAAQMENCDIRVQFSETKRIETFVGTHALGRDFHEPTMYLNLSQGNDRHKRHLILHEFGHALGLQHEHQSHNFPSQFLDLKKMNKELKNKGYKLDDWVMEGKYAVASKYDADSIMHYWIKEDWLKPGCKPEETPDPKLSKDDMAMLRKLHRRIRNLPDRISKTDKEWIGKKYKEIRGITTKQDEDTAPPGSSGSGGASQPDAADYEAKRKELIAQFKQGEKNFRKVDQATLNELVACRFPAKWGMFGLGVGLTQANLDGIKAQNCNSPNFPSSCFSAVFVKWQKTETAPYTWEQVAKVMTSKNFGCEMLETRKLLADLTKQ